MSGRLDPDPRALAVTPGRAGRAVASEGGSPSRSAAPGAVGPADFRLDQVTKTFGGLRALNNVSFTVRAGEVTVIIGPNGAGKTTAFNVLTGQVRPDSGSVWLGDRELTGSRPNQMARLGVARTFQGLRLFESMSVADNVRVSCRDEKEVRAVLAQFDLLDRADTRAGSLPYASQKVVAVARAVALRPRVLLLDEPMSGVDRKSIDTLIAGIKRLRETGLALCVIEHNMEVVERLGGRLICFNLGVVHAEGSFDELSRRRDIMEIFFGSAVAEEELEKGGNH